MADPGRSGAAELERIEGFRWMENGQSVLSGNLLALFRRLDRLYLRWAADWGSQEYRFPTFLPARDLHKLDYFRSFPHLVTFPVALPAADEALKAFVNGEVMDPSGAVRLPEPAPVCDVLTPAACYHFYVQLQGRVLEAPLYLTTRATCFRRESHYEPLRRQWSFAMREIVCIGGMDEVKAFLGETQGRVAAFLGDVGLEVAWQHATDPFFNPARSPKYLAQKLDPVKTEMVFGGDLSIGSVNFHRNYFGEAFGIRRGGEDAFSGCVAFGVERWVYAILQRFGPEPSGWPAPLRSDA